VLILVLTNKQLGFCFSEVRKTIEDPYNRKTIPQKEVMEINTNPRDLRDNR